MVPFYPKQSCLVSQYCVEAMAAAELLRRVVSRGRTQLQNGIGEKGREAASGMSETVFRAWAHARETKEDVGLPVEFYASIIQNVLTWCL